MFVIYMILSNRHLRLVVFPCTIRWPSCTWPREVVSLCKIISRLREDCSSPTHISYAGQQNQVRLGVADLFLSCMQHVMSKTSQGSWDRPELSCMLKHHSCKMLHSKLAWLCLWLCIPNSDFAQRICKIVQTLQQKKPIRPKKINCYVALSDRP